VPVMQWWRHKRKPIQGMQSQTILQLMYLRVCAVVQAQERENKEEKNRENYMDGCMKILHKDDIIAGVRNGRMGKTR